MLGLHWSIPLACDLRVHQAQPALTIWKDTRPTSLADLSDLVLRIKRGIASSVLWMANDGQHHQRTLFILGLHSFSARLTRLGAPR